MGILIHYPPNHEYIPYINWNHLAVGVFCDMAPPPTQEVRALVEANWETQGPIHITRTGEYYIFECMHHRDREAVLLRHTVIMEGKIFTFRATSELQVPGNISFNMARLWVRVHDLP